MTDFYVLLTNIGKAKITNAHATKIPVELTEMSVGDGNGEYYNPTEIQTELVNEVYRAGINEISIDDENNNWLICNLVIPSDVGGFTVREVGLFDSDGDLISIAKYPESYKPVLSDGSAKDLMIKMITEVTNTEDVILNIDPSIILATREYVEESIDENNQNYYTKPEIDDSLNKKSDNGHGHTLSDIEETETEKKLTSAEREKLLNIAEAANKYVHPSTHSIDIINNSSTHVKMTSEEQTKLAGITSGANKYIHPGTHPPSIIAENSSDRFVSDAEKSLWNYSYNHSKDDHAPSNANYMSLGSSSSTAYRGDRGTAAYNHSISAHMTATHYSTSNNNEILCTEGVSKSVLQLSIGNLITGDVVTFNGSYQSSEIQGVHLFLMRKYAGTASMIINGRENGYTSDSKLNHLINLETNQSSPVHFSVSGTGYVTKSGTFSFDLIAYVHNSLGQNFSCIDPGISAIVWRK